MTSLLFDDSLSQDKPACLFSAPYKIISTNKPSHVMAALNQIESERASGAYIAGFFSYELGYILEERLLGLLPKNRKLPLLWFGAFKTKKQLDKQALQNWLGKHNSKQYSFLKPENPSITKKKYSEAFTQVKRYIEAGDIYQLNLTFKQRFALEGCPFQLYKTLRDNQPVHYGVMIDSPDFKILSFSPEEFITIQDGTISTRPMKGTIHRGQSSEEDNALCQQLFDDDKNRAENLMIVDLMRNDLARVAKPGSVVTKELFKIEKYKTLFQMTSLISAQVQPKTSLQTLLTSLFPAGSIIGAPKLRAQEIIAELETEPRGIYTGSIGYFSPNGDVNFNVAIRTLFIDNSNQAEIGIGGGIVSDSKMQAEYQECLLKRSFLNPVKQTP